MQMIIGKEYILGGHEHEAGTALSWHGRMRVVEPTAEELAAPSGSDFKTLAERQAGNVGDWDEGTTWWIVEVTEFHFTYSREFNTRPFTFAPLLDELELICSDMNDHRQLLVQRPDGAVAFDTGEQVLELTLYGPFEPAPSTWSK